MEQISLKQTGLDLAIALGLDLDIARLIMDGKKLHILNLGMGVESSWILYWWMLNPAVRPFEDWEQLLVLIAQTGDEMRETKELMEQHLFPELRSRNVRVVQVAKAGKFAKDGIWVLDDSRQPTICHTQGVYGLFDHLGRDGTGVRFGRPHTCAQRWKGDVLDLWIVVNVLYFAWIWLTLKFIAFRHSSPQAVYQALIAWDVYGPYLGYNADEGGRVEKSDEYRCRGVRYLFPLYEYRWSRDDCLEALYMVTGQIWRKSACKQCPFPPLWAVIDRFDRDPIAGAETALTETIAMAMNPEMHQYGFGTCWELLHQTQNFKALEHLDELLDRWGWALYQLDRRYHRTKSGKKDSERRITRLTDRLPLDDLLTRLQTIADQRGLVVEFDGRFHRVYQHRKAGELPTFESFWVIAPAKIQSKVAHATNFSRRWAECTGKPDPLAPASVTEQLLLFGEIA